MNNITPYYFFLFLFVIYSCKKDSPDVTTAPEQKELVYKDSVSFVVDGKKYNCNNRYLVGSGNQQFNLKPSPIAISGRQAAKENGQYWYGPADSILYSAHYGFNTWPEFSEIKVIFSKKYKNDQLRKDIHLLVPADNSDLLKPGKQTFAVDLEHEVTLDGVAIEARLNGISGTGLLSTYIPHRWVPNTLGKDIQDNSVFEITKVQKLDKGMYCVEASFEVNLFDKNEKHYRLEKGFLRLITNLKVFGVWLQ